MEPPVPGLLVHVCCAPCAVHPLTVLLGRGLAAPAEPDGAVRGPGAAGPAVPDPGLPDPAASHPGPRFDPVVPWFYNPNIHPREEFVRRRDAVAYLAASIGRLVPGAALEVDFSPPYEPGAFLAAASLHPLAPGRCLACYRLRLSAAAKAAAGRGLAAFTTTLLCSRRQKHDLVVEAGRQAASESGVEFHYEDFRTGWRRGIELGRGLDLYRQRWCGCVYEGA
jgi:predicted adenine nucleotide alpha hydrolase (AANH) superfamily ATPase